MKAGRIANLNRLRLPLSMATLIGYLEMDPLLTILDALSIG